jgi:hypothetical protein
MSTGSSACDLSKFFVKEGADKSGESSKSETGGIGP